MTDGLDFCNDLSISYSFPPLHSNKKKHEIMKLINKSKLTFSGSHVVSNIDASSSGETAHQRKGTADQN